MMTDERLAELELQTVRGYGLGCADSTELIAEMRRLRAALEQISALDKRFMHSCDCANESLKIARKALGR